MREAIDYNALSWIRQEVGVTLKQARLELEEYAEGEQRKELLQGCAAHLHEARGPLRMVNIRGADLLACEMEEAIADLLLNTAIDRETLIEQLMQGFLELPEYLANLRPGKAEKPKELFPLVNSLRAARGLQPLKEDTVTAPDLSVSMPQSEFDSRSRRLNKDLATLARTARVRFQGGLLEWYRDGGSNHGLQALVEVLVHLQSTAYSEPAARLWWVAAGVAELLRDGVLTTSPAVKRLFGQLDRQIKRLMDSSESIFSDVLSEDLLKNLLRLLAGVVTESSRVNLIRRTYGIPGPKSFVADQKVDDRSISDELLQTVSMTASENVERIKEQLDALTRNPSADRQTVLAVANGLHALGNTLGMIGMDRLGARMSVEERRLRDHAADDAQNGYINFNDLANVMIAVEDVLSDMSQRAGVSDAGEDQSDSMLRQGQQAVINAVIADIVAAKDSINGFLNSSGDYGQLNDVPDILHKICGGLELVGEERLAAVSRQVGNFISVELLEKHRQLDAEELDSLADAICSIEYCVEELGESHKYGERAIGVANESLVKLGYPDARVYGPEASQQDADEPAMGEMPVVRITAVDEPAIVMDTTSVQEESLQYNVPTSQGVELPNMAESEGDGSSIAQLQVVAPDADAEIVDIFIEEAGEVLERLAVDIPSWVTNPDDRNTLVEIRRAFHTIKGSGRMIGAMAAGETAWVFESLLNRVIEGAIPASTAVLELVGSALPALKDLVAQVRNPETKLRVDVTELGRRAAELSESGEYVVCQECVTEIPDDVEQIPGYGVGEEGLDAEEIAAALRGRESGQPVEMSDGAISSMSITDVRNGLLEEQVVETALDETIICGSHDETAAELPILKSDADPEIVEVFLEEAAEELDSISLKIPEWIQYPEDNDLLGDIRRSMHTLKGSGRMAGAMLAGEFAWSIETLLSKLIEGVTKPGGAIFALLAQVPQAMSGLLRQLEDGSVPEFDIAGMIRKATELAGGDVSEFGGLHADDALDLMLTSSEVENAPAVDEDEDDVVLLELYTAECREHLGNLGASDSDKEAGGMVTDAQYRALHTLLGISESASVPGIGRLAAALYDYFGGCYQDKYRVTGEAFSLLDECVAEMQAQLERLPDRSYDLDVVDGLHYRISHLPDAIMPVDEAESSTSSDAEMLQESAGNVASDIVVIPEIQPADVPVYGDNVVVPDAGDADHAAADEVARSDSDDTPVAVDVPETETGVAPTGGRDRREDNVYAAMDQEMYEIFVEEATEIIDCSDAALRNWSESPHNSEFLAEFQRQLHTLKGGARMVDISAIGDLSHALESLLTLVTDDAVSPGDDLFILLQESHDRLAEMVEKVKARIAIEPAFDLEARLKAFKRGEGSTTATVVAESAHADVIPPQDILVRLSETDSTDVPMHYAEVSGYDDEDETDEDGNPPEYSNTENDAGLMVEAIAGQSPMMERRKEGRSRGELVRVQADVLDNLVNNAGEINIYRSRLEQQISGFRFNLTELDQTIGRLRDQLRQLEIETEAQILFRYEQEAENSNQDFDPLELDRYSKLQQLSRSLIESISDLRSLQNLMEANSRDSETLLLQQSRVSTDLQETLIRTRMIPFSGLAPRLRRIVRQSARQLDKRVELHLRGAEGEMDRAVIERIVAPLEHMLRNAVAHGIEHPERRKISGKRVTGTIMIEFSREGTEILLQISDDGAGLDIGAIRRRAIERGLMDPGVPLPDADVMQFVLQTGFSTASEVTQIAGRGVGMDVVNSEVKQLGGSLHIDSEAGRGTVFTIRLPYTLAINQALLITLGEQVFCVPMGSVEGIVSANPEQLRSCYRDNGQAFEYAGHNYQLMHLGTLLGISRMDLENAINQIPILLVRAGDKRIGVQVDSVLGSREVVIKPLGAQLSLVDGITGATILADGRVVMILDMFAVSRMKVREHNSTRQAGLQDDGRLVVMVVDDSITVRKVTTRLLERSGYRVMTAKDGVDAMGQLQEVVPDMMLLDIEMPRMDGFELATHMRNDERLKHVPIIMITSRTGDKHRQRALEIGVNEYLGKPYQESELLASINNIIGVDVVAVRA